MATQTHPCRISRLKYWHTFSAIFLIFFFCECTTTEKQNFGQLECVTHVNKRPNGNQMRVGWSQFQNVFLKETEDERLRQCRAQYSGLLPPRWRRSLRQTPITTPITNPARQQTGNIDGLPTTADGCTHVRVLMRWLWIFQQHREHFPTSGSMLEAENHHWLI